ncbi:flagellar export protein FliJ [Candidatus Margulisiibacteriota bacterium]
MTKPKKGNRFKYNLAAVLKVREIRETQEQEKFKQAEKKYLEEEKKEKEIKDFQQEKYSELRKTISPGSTISNFQEVLMRKSHLEILKDKVIEQERVKEEAEEIKEDQRDQLIKAVKDKKIMEKDQERKKGQWKKLMDKEHGKFLDEIAGIGHERKRRESQE